MPPRFLVLLLLLVSSHSPALAANLACPDLASAVRVGTCPSEEELRYTYNGYCGDNNRLYGREAEVCAVYANYRKLKNVVLWESADGEFSAYLSCDLPDGALKAARATAIKVTRQGSMTRLICSYGEQLTFTHRTRAECTVDGTGACPGDGAACQASCR